jgi:hypothetical protein
MSKEEYISQYKYLGKTVKEWEEEAKTVDGLDEDGNPSWWGPQANATYGRVFAIISYENQNKDEMS